MSISIAEIDLAIAQTKNRPKPKTKKDLGKLQFLVEEDKATGYFAEYIAKLKLNALKVYGTVEKPGMIKGKERKKELTNLKKEITGKRKGQFPFDLINETNTKFEAKGSTTLPEGTGRVNQIRDRSHYDYLIFVFILKDDVKIFIAKSSLALDRTFGINNGLTWSGTPNDLSKSSLWTEL